MSGMIMLTSAEQHISAAKSRFGHRLRSYSYAATIRAPTTCICYNFSPSRTSARQQPRRNVLPSSASPSCHHQAARAKRAAHSKIYPKLSKRSSLDTFEIDDSMAGSAYGKGRDYWDKRYRKDDEQFDWYQRYDTLKHILNEVTPKSFERILMVGCGNSRMTEHMIADGYGEKSITSIDISPVVIEQMRSKHPEFDWRVADATKMPEFQDHTFDAAIDKGTLDAILCGEGSAENTDRMLSEMTRIIKPGGVFVLITYGQPKTRLHYLSKEKYGWEIEQRTVAKQATPGSNEKPDVHYIYICTKKK